MRIVGRWPPAQAHVAGGNDLPLLPSARVQQEVRQLCASKPLPSDMTKWLKRKSGEQA